MSEEPIVPEPEPAAEDRVSYQSLRGMRDILPHDAAIYQEVENAFFDVAKLHGFQEIRTPALEPTDLFTRTVGESSDIVHKELYSFVDRSDNQVSLRPEGTASVARAYLQNGMTGLPQPVRLCYAASMYRYERPQAGRYREHQQFGLEVFGSADPAIDAQIMLIAGQVHERLDLDGIVVHVNSIGQEASRKAIRQAIVDTLSPHREKLSEDARRQLIQNPLRILDSKDPAMDQWIGLIPPLIDQLTPEDRDHFTQVLEYLEGAGIPFELDSRLVRGLDYYTRTVFEFVQGDSGVSLGSGGRYDRLVEHIGGPPVPAVGMGNGIDRLVEAVKTTRRAAQETVAQVFVVQLGDAAKSLSFALVDQLTKAGISVTSALGKDSIRSQLKLADKLHIPLALIIGQKEALTGSLIIRDMASGMQETIPVAGITEHLQRRLPGTIARITHPGT